MIKENMLKTNKINYLGASEKISFRLCGSPEISGVGREVMR